MPTDEHILVQQRDDFKGTDDAADKTKEIKFIEEQLISSFDHYTGKYTTFKLSTSFMYINFIFCIEHTRN